MEPEQKTEQDVVLPMLVVYAHPRDYPSGFVVRRWSVVRGAAEPVPSANALGFRSLEHARHWIEQHHPSLVCMHRSPEDDPCIVETYF